MSVVGVVILITLILLLQLISEMLAAPPTPTVTVEELRQQIASLQPLRTELQDSIAELHRFREKSEAFTPSQDKVDAIQSTVDRLEADIAATEKKIDEIKKRIDELQNDPAIKQLTEIQQEIKDLTDEIADLKQQTQDISDNATELQAKVRELKAKNTDLDSQLASRAGVQLKISVPKDSDKTAFLLDYGQGVITVIPADGSAKQTFSSRSQFSNWVSRRDYKTEHFVVYARPSRFGQHDEIVKDLRARGFDVGLQVIGEKTNLSLND
jgi:phage shock protein A